MVTQQLQGHKIAILATDGFEQAELFEPKKALEGAGAVVILVSPKAGEIKGWDHSDWGGKIAVDLKLEEARAEGFDALVLPGGVLNPDKLRMDPLAVEFVRDFFAAGKPVAAICHGPQLLIEADVLRGRKLTSWPSLKTDLRNAGAEWVDQQVMVDNGLVTSRMPEDIPAFNQKMIEEFVEGRHNRQIRHAHLSQESRLQ